MTNDYKQWFEKGVSYLPMVLFVLIIMFIDSNFGWKYAGWSLLLGSVGLAAVRIWMSWDEIKFVFQLVGMKAEQDKAKALSKKKNKPERWFIWKKKNT